VDMLTQMEITSDPMDVTTDQSDLLPDLDQNQFQNQLLSQLQKTPMLEDVQFVVVQVDLVALAAQVAQEVLVENVQYAEAQEDLMNHRKLQNQPQHQPQNQLQLPDH